MSILRNLVGLIRLRLALRQLRRSKCQLERIKRKNADIRALLLRLGFGAARAPMSIHTTKRCPSCGDPCMVPLYSTNTKICPSCGTEIPWALTGDQKPTHQPHRAQRKAIQE